MRKELREDQSTGIENVREAMRETRRVVMQGPTGFGKTVVGASICESALAKDKRVLVTVPALSLVDQTVEAFYNEGINSIGVIQANHYMTDASKRVQIASVQTLVSRGIGNVQADVVIVDEVHKWFNLFEQWFAQEKWQKVPIIGFSATPWTRGLGKWFDRLVVANTIENMVAQGTLAPFKVYAAARPDLKGVRTVAGEWVASDLDERVRKPKLVADIVQTWKDLGEDRPTVAFCVTRAHAAQIAKEFQDAGVPSGYMDCETPNGERREIRRRFLAGDIRVLCNVDVIGLGVDWPEVSCISYCRPTKSEMRYVQNIGRGLRTSPGKTDLIIIDHSDTTRRLGFVTDIQYSELDDGKTRVKTERGVELPKECPQCHYMKPPRMVKCPACGFEVAFHAKPVLVERGTLKEIKPDFKKATAADRFPNKSETYAMLLGYAQSKGHKPGLAYHKYHALYGCYPPNGWGPRSTKPIPPSDDLTSWIISSNIKWARSQRKSRWNQRERDAQILERVTNEFLKSKSSLMTEADYEEFR